ncbi:hypothetical protein ABUE34_08480 [Kozakia baliensis]|uniref:hypothetical protein n=1 Tax=Kozakia baliensis TaxID=153496 RepID=UPI00345C60F0
MEGVDISQFKHLIVVPTLAALGLGSPSAVNLVTGTALAESRGAYLRQINGGPALGFWQMEPATHDDCWENFLNFPAQSRLKRVLEGMLSNDLPKCAQLVGNLRYASAMARIRFYRVGAPLPMADDAMELSLYHKQHYNTYRGAADPAANAPLFRRAVQA